MRVVRRVTMVRFGDKRAAFTVVMRSAGRLVVRVGRGHFGRGGVSTCDRPDDGRHHEDRQDQDQDHPCPSRRFRRRHRALSMLVGRVSCVAGGTVRISWRHLCVRRRRRMIRVAVRFLGGSAECEKRDDPRTMHH